MTINQTPKNGHIVLSLEGRLNTTTAPQLQQALAEAFKTASSVELDFMELVYLSSAGLRVLLMGEKMAKSSGKTMALKNVLPDVMEVLQMTGFADILTIL